MDSALYPEHKALVGELVQLQDVGRLPHAMLLTSDSGLGLKEVCQQLAHALLKGQGEHLSRTLPSCCLQERMETFGGLRPLRASQALASIKCVSPASSFPRLRVMER